MEYRIRPFRPEDLPQLNAMRADPQLAATLDSLPTERVEHTASQLNNNAAGEHLFVAVNPENRLLGLGQLYAETLPRYDHKGSLGLMVALDAQGQGVGRALMGTLLDLADNWLLLDRLELTVFAKNARAIHLYHSLGFRDEAVAPGSIFGDGRYQDEIDMARLRPGFVPIPPTEEAAALPKGKTGSPWPIRIRPLRREDVPAVARIEINRDVFKTTVSLPSTREADMQRWYERLDGYTEHTLVAEAMRGEGPAVLGLVNLHLSSNPRLRHKGEVGIMIAPEGQGQGIGRRLMEAMLDVADNWMGLKRLELVVFARNTRARALYRKMGFAEEGTYRYSAKGSGGHLDEVLMGRVQPDWPLADPAVPRR